MASDRALADEMMSISRALAERDSELRVRAKALDSALPELKREADAYGDELRVRVEVHYELLLGKVDDLLHTVQSEVREEALRARGVSSRIAALERENAALRSQLETRSSSLEQSTAIAVRERQRSALARQRAKAANVASEAVQRKIVASAAAAAEREEILASEARQLRRRLLRLRTEHRAENEHLQQHAAEAAASAAAAREAAAAVAAAKRTRAQPKARPAAGAHAARSGDALGEGGTPELMAFIEFFLARRAPPSPQDARAEGGGSASASCLLPGARALLSSSAVPPRLQLLLLELCLDLVSPFISPSLRSSHGASSGAASAADDAAARQLRAPLRDFEGTASALMRAENASVRLRAAMLVLHLDAFRALAPGGGGSGALARASGEATERALATLLRALQASAAAAFSGASSASLLDVDRAGERDGAAAPSGAATEHDAERSGRRAEEYDASRVPPMVAIVRWSAPYVFRLVLSKGASIDRAAASRPGQRATAVRILVSLLCDGGALRRARVFCSRALALSRPAPARRRRHATLHTSTLACSRPFAPLPRARHSSPPTRSAHCDTAPDVPTLLRGHGRRNQALRATQRRRRRDARGAHASAPEDDDAPHGPRQSERADILIQALRLLARAEAPPPRGDGGAERSSRVRRNERRRRPRGDQRRGAEAALHERDAEVRQRIVVGPHRAAANTEQRRVAPTGGCIIVGRKVSPPSPEESPLSNVEHHPENSIGNST